MPTIAAILSFCSNDWRFFERSILELRSFSSQILVTICDHFFDGAPENYALLEAFYRQYPDITFIEFEYSADRSYRYASILSSEHHLWRHEWHNTGRWIAHFFVNKEIEYVYFCDGDEITDGLKFAKWLKNDEYKNYTAIRLASYWYFREAKYCALGTGQK